MWGLRGRLKRGMRKYRRFVGNPKGCAARSFSFSLDYGGVSGTFPKNVRALSTQTISQWRRSPDNGFTVLSRNDAGFALILSETARKIGSFAGSAPQRSLNALNERRNLPPAARHRRFYPESRPLRFKRGTFAVHGPKNSHLKQAINLKGKSLSSTACAFLGPARNIDKLG
jgi:hypothetical protein